MSEFFKVWFDEMTGRFALDFDQNYYIIINDKGQVIRIYKRFHNAAREVLQTGTRTTSRIQYIETY